MNTIAKGIITTASIALFSAASTAGVIVDTISNFDNGGYVGWWDEISYTHDITSDVLGAPFTPGSDVAISGLLEIDIYDDSSSFKDDCIFTACIPEIAVFVIEGLDFDTDSVSLALNGLNSQLELNALAAINTDGLLDVNVWSLWGDFVIGESRLTVTTADSTGTIDQPVTAVPEPGSVALLGLGLVALVASRRYSNG